MFKNLSRLTIILSFLAIITSILTSYLLIPGHTVFAYDQARDAYNAYEIWHDHTLKLLGPTTDIPGVYHGVIWYYFLAVLYALGQNSPEIVVAIMVTGFTAMIPLLWYFTKKMTKDSVATAITIALYTLSPLYVMFILWLSNPTLSLFIAPPLFYLLWKYVNKPTWLLASLIGFFYGLLIQSDFGFLVLLAILPLYYLVFKIRFSLKEIATFVGGLFIGILPLLISYIKFKTNIIAILITFLKEGSEGDFSGWNTTGAFIDILIRLFTFTYLPASGLLVFFILLFVIFSYRKGIGQRHKSLQTYTLVWLSGMLLIFVLNRNNMHNFFFAPFLYPLALLIAIFLTQLIKNMRVLVSILAIIFVLQGIQIFSWAQREYSPLSVQRGTMTSYEKEIVEYTYEASNKKPFVITTITSPLWVNTTWSYWYTTHGNASYDYLPYFWGKDQSGRIGNLPAQKDSDLSSPSIRYLIIEPTEGIEEHWIKRGIYEEDLLSDIVEEKQFGNFIVQKRLYHQDKPLIATPSGI